MKFSMSARFASMVCFAILAAGCKEIANVPDVGGFTRSTAAPTAAPQNNPNPTPPLANNVGFPPSARGQDVVTQENTAKDLTLESTPSGAFAIVAPPTQGILIGTPPNVTYVPFANASGADVFKFDVTNAAGKSDPATVSISIAPRAMPTFCFRATPAAATTEEVHVVYVITGPTSVRVRPTKSPITLVLGSTTGVGNWEIRRDPGAVIKAILFYRSYDAGGNKTAIAGDIGNATVTPVDGGITGQPYWNVPGWVPHYQALVNDVRTRFGTETTYQSFPHPLGSDYPVIVPFAGDPAAGQTTGYRMIDQDCTLKCQGSAGNNFAVLEPATGVDASGLVLSGTDAYASTNVERACGKYYLEVDLGSGLHPNLSLGGEAKVYGNEIPASIKSVGVAIDLDVGQAQYSLRDVNGMQTQQVTRAIKSVIVHRYRFSVDSLFQDLPPQLFTLGFNFGQTAFDFNHVPAGYVSGLR